MLTSAKWVLIFYMVHTTPGGEESVTHHRDEKTYTSLASCQTAGNDRLAVIDVPEGYSPYFACVPDDAIEAR
jgi:hypothetical protein